MSSRRSKLWVGAVAMVGWWGCQAPPPPEPDTEGSGGESAEPAAGSGGHATGGRKAEGGSGGTGAASGGAGAGGTLPSGAGGVSPADAASADGPDEPSPDASIGSDGAAPASSSPGCGRNNPAGTFMITAGAAQTPYRVVLPSNYDPAKPYPLVFYLHGRGNNIEGQGNLTRDVAGANLGIVVYPKSYASSGWEVPGRDRPVENEALLRALIKHMGEQYCVNPSKVMLTGFSSGCWFGSRMTCNMKDVLAGVVVAACGLDGMGKCPDRKPITYIIGRGDQAFGGAAAAAEFYRNRNGCQMTRKPAATSPCERYDGCAPGAPATYCPHPGGHMWPGFASKAVLELLDEL